MRPDGVTRYTRIVGWGNEPPPGEAEFIPADDPQRTREPEAEAFSGLRMYPERDVVLETSHGRIVVAMRPDEAPNTAWNFVHLAGEGFYDGVVFHRVVPLDREGRPFVIQGGDPTATGDGGPGYWLPMEPGGLHHEFGVISMARADDPDSAGSQFFFCLSREGTERLDGQYCAFGYAIEGGEVIRSIASLRLADAQKGRPENPAVITEAYLIPAPPRRPGSGRPDAKVEPGSPEASGSPSNGPR
jgi:peptidyl-prolyl cis-trans isomerase B (cyclophilin B)